MLKKSFFLLIFIVFLINYQFNLLNNNYIIFAQSSYYARIVTQTAYLYKAPELTPDNTNILFSLPTTYFVKVLEKEINDYYKVEYMDKIGYVKSTDIRFVSGTPQKAYANKMSFRSFANGGLSLRTTPYSVGGGVNLITTIPFLETNLLFYGESKGEEAIPYKGDTWYYCKYYSSDSVYEGYVYSIYCDMLSELTPNLETMEYIEAPSFESEANPTAPVDNLSKLDTSAQVAIIGLASIPCIAIVYFLFKPTKIALETSSSAKHKGKKKKIKKLRHSDYYELDDEFFNS